MHVNLLNTVILIVHNKTVLLFLSLLLFSLLSLLLLLMLLLSFDVVVFDINKISSCFL